MAAEMSSLTYLSLNTVTLKDVKSWSNASEQAVLLWWQGENDSDDTVSSCDMAFYRKIMPPMEVIQESPHVPAANSSAISLMWPLPYTVFQRSGTTGTIKIVGINCDVSRMHEIEASFNGGAFVTIACVAGDGDFSSDLTGQAQGSGTLTVRFVDMPHVYVKVEHVGISEVLHLKDDFLNPYLGIPYV